MEDLLPQPWLYQVIIDNLIGLSLCYPPSPTLLSASDPRFECNDEYIGINVNTRFADTRILRIHQVCTRDLVGFYPGCAVKL